MGEKRVISVYYPSEFKFVHFATVSWSLFIPDNARCMYHAHRFRPLDPSCFTDDLRKACRNVPKSFHPSGIKKSASLVTGVTLYNNAHPHKDCDTAWPYSTLIFLYSILSRLQALSKADTTTTTVYKTNNYLFGIAKRGYDERLVLLSSWASAVVYGIQ